jgi:hypothetical protein
MRLVPPGVFHRDEAVHDVSQVREVFQGHLYGDSAFGGDDGDLYFGGAQTGERLFDLWEFLDQGVVVLLVVTAVGLEQEFGSFGIDKLHLAREGWPTFASRASLGMSSRPRTVLAAWRMDWWIISVVSTSVPSKSKRAASSKA